MKAFCLTLLLASVTPPLTAQALWTGPAGGGMAAVQEAGILPAGKSTLGILQDNYDRDPLGLDIDEFRVAGRTGLGHSVEFYGWYYFSRAVVVPGPSPVPAPPLDIVVASGQSPRPPYRTMYWQLPYLAHHSAASIGRLIQGDVTLGLKVGLSGQKGWKPATAFSLQVIAPSDTSSRMLGRGSSDGVVDFGLHCAATWSLNNRASVSANLGLIRLADLADADRVIDSTGTHVMPNERPSLLRLAAGIRFKVYKESSLVVEAFQLSPVGGHTPVFNESGATDAIIGLEIPFRRLAITAAYRLHLRPQPNDRMLTTGPLAGAVDLSDVEPGARAKYLQSVGAPVVGDLNDNVVVVGAPQGDLPAGARSIPANFTTSTTGNGGTVFSISYRF